MTKLRIYISLFALCILVSGCGQAPSVAANSGEYVVHDVVDGDTVELTVGKKVRYIGIDAPETMQRVGSGWAFSPEAFGLAAKDYNQNRVMGKTVRLEFDREKQDKYGRWLAYVYREESMVNLELVKEGYAIVYTFPPNLKHYDEFIRAQREARMLKKGLWGTMIQVPPNEAADHIGKFRRIKGTIQDVHIAKSGVYLSFGPDRKKYLTAIIFARNLPLFSREGIDPLKHYRDRPVEVTGKIEDRGGPEMIIDNPSQIRLLAE